MCRLVVLLSMHLIVATQVVYGGKGQLILKAVTELLMALHELLLLTSLVCTVKQDACLQRALRPLHHKQGADSKCKSIESQHNLTCPVRHPFACVMPNANAPCARSQDVNQALFNILGAMCHLLRLMCTSAADASASSYNPM